MKPIPKRPVFASCPRFFESPMLCMLSKSSSENTPSLYTNSAGPCCFTDNQCRRQLRARHPRSAGAAALFQTECARCGGRWAVCAQKRCRPTHLKLGELLMRQACRTKRALVDAKFDGARARVCECAVVCARVRVGEKTHCHDACMGASARVHGAPRARLP